MPALMNIDSELVAEKVKWLSRKIKTAKIWIKIPKKSTSICSIKALYKHLLYKSWYPWSFMPVNFLWIEGSSSDIVRPYYFRPYKVTEHVTSRVSWGEFEAK